MTALITAKQCADPQGGVCVQCSGVQSSGKSGGKAAFTNWAFVGGTALRFLYSLPRYSEDLDFSITGPKLTGDRFEKLMSAVRVDLGAEGYRPACSRTLVTRAVDAGRYASAMSGHRRY